MEFTFITTEDYKHFYEECNRLAMMISALKNSLKDISVNGQRFHGERR